MNNHKRLVELDCLRGIAAICVFFCHFQLAFKIEPGWVSIFKSTPFGFLVNGRAAVMFFFVLSGFVLSLPFISKDKPLNLLEFYVKRIFRLYPAYIVAILFAWALKSGTFNHSNLASFSEWINSFWGWDKINYHELLKSIVLIGPKFNDQYFDPVVWSLRVEMQMSLMLPFFIIIASRSRLLFNLLFLFVLIWIIYYDEAHNLGVFFIGILCAKYKVELVEFFKKLNIIALLGILALSVFVYNIYFEILPNFSDQSMWYNFQYFVKDYLTASAGAVFLITALARTRISQVLTHSVFKFLGAISYSFYLLNLPILIVACSIFKDRSQFSSLYIFLTSLALTLIIASLMFWFIEKPFQVFGNKIIKRFNFDKLGSFVLQ